MEDTLTIPEEVQTEQQVPQEQKSQGDPPSKKLYDGLVAEKLYSKSYDEFTKQYSTPETIAKLHDGLVEEKLYSKTGDEFVNQYFPTVKKKESGSLPSVKDKILDYHSLIKKPVIPKEQDINQPASTEAVQPKISASYDDFVAHNDERVAKKNELKKEAVNNAAWKVLKNKGVIKPEEEGKELNLSQFAQLTTEKNRLQQALDNGDATFAISKDGEVGLKKTIGFWDSLTKGWNQATKANDEAADFANADSAGKLAILKKQQEEAPPPSGYLGERPSNIGSIGQMAGENAPFLGKAITGAVVGTGAVLAAPETMGASIAGLPAAMSFLFTANDAKNHGIQSEVTRRFAQLKHEQPDADEVELMKEAEKGALVGGMAGILTNAALMSSVKTPLSDVAKGVVGKSVSKAVGNAVYGGAATAGIEGLKMAEGSLEGIKTTPTEIAKEMGKTFSETATTLGILHVMTGVVSGALTLPNVVKSAFKYALKDANPTEIQNTLKANVEAGTITHETAEKVTTDLDQYKAALSKTPNSLSPEAEASVAGLIQAKGKLIAEMKTKDDTAKPFYEEKIEGINEQIQKTVNTGKPYAHEIDEISGEKYTEHKPEEKPSIVVEPPKQIPEPILIDEKSEPTIKPEEVVKNLEQERDEKIKEVSKPDLQLDTISMDEILGSTEPAKNKFQYNDITKRFEQIKKIIDCLHG